MQYYLHVLKNYVGFSGRASRKEYWMFTLVNLFVTIALAIVDGVADTDQLFSSLYSLAVLLPTLAVGARRLHDTGKSGWWQLITLIPIIGAIILLVFFVKDSDPGDNKFGPNPKAKF
ncbi:MULTISPECIES: DUF805 domain-containing protein [unclassified Bacillus (in: firmicutes)]|uniref:DUF805 domain-containing protein n=1 Tax=unclassified Bacillus (in: firmicutes) TaxID=185979 RepID=UPI0008E79423|nr:MULTISPECIES: DUF805 domain-containing protein [unclassified Bacillus (in: firmicutes)]SFB04501.1 Uncharacterized membrane protein YhaH, DUF805 family [Bacillus sp. UNCCL13]SFQ88498.1 Uncharacterized membrane protein YhaH, DUF805 family [Bacillus sp. cl95]